MPKSPTEKIDKRVKYDAAFRAEALRLASQSRSASAAARALHRRVKLLYDGQKAAHTPAAATGANLDPATAAQVRQWRADNRRQAQERALLKKAVALFSTPLTP
jgi:transposase